MNDNEKMYYYELGYKQATFDALTSGILIGFSVGVMFCALLNWLVG